MRRKMIHKAIAVFVCILFSANCFAQGTFDYNAQLDEVKQSSFYKVQLPPSVIAKCQYYLEDLRILDDKGNQVAYIIKQDAAQFVESSFIEFPIISKTKEKDGQTHITIENKTGSAINDLLLVTSNMDARRIVNIGGSNDLKDWFVVKEGIWLDNYFSKRKEDMVQTVSLPTINYKYFQVTVIGKDILPFNIVRAGIYKENYTKGKYISISPPVVEQRDSSDKRSYVQLKFDEANKIDKLLLDVDGPKFFNRNISVYLGNHFSTKTPFTTFLTPTNSELSPGGMKSKEWLFVINNDDNTPLKIKSVKAFQLNQYLLAYLEAGKSYHLAFGDSMTKAPVYDLAFFKDSIGKNPVEIKLVNMKSTFVVRPSIGNHFSTRNKVILWGIIVVISILLLAFTYKMSKEISKRKNNADI